jgi:hypothetical protein
LRQKECVYVWELPHTNWEPHTNRKFFLAGMARVPPPVLFLLGCLVCSIWGECEFIPQYSYEGSDYAGVSTADLKACFESVAFDEERRQKTLASLMQLTDLYVFTDIAKNSPSPYTVEVKANFLYLFDIFF